MKNINWFILSMGSILGCMGLFLLGLLVGIPLKHFEVITRETFHLVIMTPLYVAIIIGMITTIGYLIYIGIDMVRSALKGELE